MTLKHLLSICWFGLFTSTNAVGQASEHGTNLSGTLANFDNEAKLEDISEFYELRLSPAVTIFRGDAKNAFTISIQQKRAGYFRLGRNILYLLPGERLQAFVDYDDPAHAVFTGRTAALNAYLRGTPFPKQGSYINGGLNVKGNPQATIDTIFALANKRQRELAALRNVPSAFFELERARIRADIINSLDMGKYYPPSQIGDAEQEVYARSFDSLARAILPKYTSGFINPMFLQLPSYREICQLLVNQCADTNSIRQVKDWLAARKLFGQLREVNDKAQLRAFEGQINAISSGPYRHALLDAWNQLVAYGSGDVATDFVATDHAGNAVRLSKFRGKTIYIDVWATWCGPCIDEMPAFEQLAGQFKNDTNIVFVSLSIDHSPDLWRRFTEKRGMGGIQWLADRLVLSAYRILTVPRTLIINRDFKVEFMEGPLPSSDTIAAILRRLVL